jgi:Arc/MetJ family transcription regulator
MADDEHVPVLLAGLDNIDWSTTWDAYGPAIKTPGMLRALASPDAKVQQEALGDLSYTIYHQGSVYPAAVDAVPFLAELLNSPEVRHKRPVVEILILLAAGGSYAENHASFQLFQNADARDEKFSAKLDAETKAVTQLRSRIREHLPSYLALLQDAEPETRMQATALLVRLKDLAEQSFPAIETVVGNDPDPAVRANALIALARLDRGRAESILRQTELGDRDELPRTAALMWLVIINGQGAGSDRLSALHTLLVQSSEPLKKSYGRLPCAGRFDEDAASSLAAADGHYARLALGYLLPRLKGQVFLGDSTMMTLLYVAERADGRLAQATKLSDGQAEAVRVVAAVAWPKANHTMCNAVDVLRAFGLPTKKDAVESLLQAPLMGETSTATSTPTILAGAPSRAAEVEPHERRWWQFWRKD